MYESHSKDQVSVFGLDDDDDFEEFSRISAPKVGALLTCLDEETADWLMKALADARLAEKGLHCAGFGAQEPISSLRP